MINMVDNTEKPIFPLIPSDNCKKDDLSDQKGPGIVMGGKHTPWLSRFVWVGESQPPKIEEGGNQLIELNYTGPPGDASRIYYALMFQMLKWKWNIVKVDENIEVSPTHREYYERTIATKGALEGTIKEGLRSAAQAIADYELIQHDIRRYKEVMDYFTGVAKARQITSPKLRKEKLLSAEHALKSMYADQVDVHTGGASLVQMAQTRWPTVLSDFMRLTDEMDTMEKIRKELGISNAEALVLKNKNDLFREWMRNFGGVVKDRYARLTGIAVARQKSVDEYREWIRPYVIRFKSMKAAAPKDAFKSWLDITGQAMYRNNIKLWAWQPYRAVEIRKAPMLKSGDFVVDPADLFTVEHFIKSAETGLAHKDFYPWLLNHQEPSGKPTDYPWIEYFSREKVTVADEIILSIKKKWKEKEIGGTDVNDLYYLFLAFDINRTGTRLQVGEQEDIVFDLRMHMISQNALLVRLVELECREREIGRYIEEMLGLKKDEKSTEELVKGEFPELFGVKPPKPPGTFELFVKQWKETIEALLEPFRSFEKKVMKPRPWLVKTGPYESDFDERIAKQYLIPSGQVFGTIVGFIQSKMGVE